MEKALVFNIERCATDDGGGIRTVVFLKGCILQCQWCSNPESQRFRTDVLFHEHLCRGCSTCVQVCPNKAVHFVKEYGFITDPSDCNACGRCVDSCLYNARTLSGEEKSSDEMMDLILKDREYYEQSGGGVTFSGGEPFLHSVFLEELLPRLSEKGIHILIETCGHVSQNRISPLLNSIDEIFFDVKHIDPEIHRKLTGVDNQMILNNLKFINDNFKGRISVRYPVIPGKNDRDEDIEGFYSRMLEFNNLSEIVFLPYHRLGLSKYSGLGRPYLMGDVPALKKRDLEGLVTRFNDRGLTVKIQ